jgi:hypothetical protein
MSGIACPNNLEQSSSIIPIDTDPSGEPSKDNGERSRKIGVSLDRAVCKSLGQSRDDLFDLSNPHPDFVKECFAAIDAKKERLHRRVMGELLAGTSPAILHSSQ